MNRWVVITLALMAAVVVGRHLQRLSDRASADPTPPAAALNPLAVQEAHADPLPPVESGTEPVSEGGALAVPETEAVTRANLGEDSSEAHPQRVPLNPEPPLPEKDRPRSTRAQGPLTSLDSHQLLFEPGEKTSQPAPARDNPKPLRRAPAATKGPVTEVDPRQMLFEPGERPPRGATREAPAAIEERPDVGTQGDRSDAAPEPALEPSTDAQTKARIMKRLLRVMELAGEKP